MFLIFLLVFLTGEVHADEICERLNVYTMKITATEQTETVKEVTLLQLKTEEARKKEEIANNYQKYLETNNSLNAELADIQYKIAEAVKLGIEEERWIEEE